MGGKKTDFMGRGVRGGADALVVLFQTNHMLILALQLCLLQRHVVFKFNVCSYIPFSIYNNKYKTWETQHQFVEKKNHQLLNIEILVVKKKKQAQMLNIDISLAKDRKVRLQLVKKKIDMLNKPYSRLSQYSFNLIFFVLVKYSNVFHKISTVYLA